MVEGFDNKEELEIFENRLKEKNEVFYLIWKVGVNLALRVSDVLKITVEEAKEYVKTGIYKARDKKTKKHNLVKINNNTLKAFQRALEIRDYSKVSRENKYLFVGQGNRVSNSLTSISRQAVDKYFKKAADDENLKIQIGTHTMRKTWGRLAYKKGYRVEEIMKRLNHSSEGITLIYLGITNKHIDDIVADLEI